MPEDNVAVVRRNQSWSSKPPWAGLLGLAALALCLAAPAAAAPPQPEPYRAHDAGGFRNVLPPGQGTNATPAQIAAFEANGTYPPHTHDQLGMYSNLLYAAQGLGAPQIDDYFKDASFGVAPGGLEGQPYSPRGDVTIERDKFGVPHIYGSGRAGAIFGTGYAAAQDRLFLIDVLRHTGRAELSSFAGGENRAMDESIWADTPYTEQDLQRQYDDAARLHGQQGIQLQKDLQNYAAGINKYIGEICATQVNVPGEYALIASVNPDTNICLPENRWKVTDVVSIGALVGGIFGKGGGGEVANALRLEAAQEKFGMRKGKRVYADFKEANDPEAPATVHGKRFPYGGSPRHPRGLALPDPGTVEPANVIRASTGGASASTPATMDEVQSEVDGILGALAEQTGHSNALLISGRKSQSGRPIAVMGPQVGYFSPQILMEEDVHAPGGTSGPPIDARGTAFPGTNLYVELGRGRNYAWSATSASQDIIDTYAVKLCDPAGGKPGMDSNYYRFGGRCLPFETLTRSNSWGADAPAEPPSPGSETLQALRSKLGIVTARTKIAGKPYAYTQLRDTYFHELDPSAFGFTDFNDPRKMRTPRDFMKSANKISLTFNWFYINRHHIAYFNSGKDPVRPRGVDPTLPTLGKKRFLWRKFNPGDATEAELPRRAHPQVIDQKFLTSWNNRPAPGYDVGYSSIYRSQPLDQRIRADIAGGRKASLPELIGDMEDAGTVDLRGDRVLPWILKVLESGPVRNADARTAIRALATWEASGAHRIDRDRDGHYEQSEAVRIMDAWWPRLVRAQFKPTVGKALFNRLPLADDPPGLGLGSAYNSSSYGIVQKDLRDALGARVRGRFSRVYCGRGKLAKCRRALLGSMRRALAHDSDSDLYPDGGCTMLGGVQADAQACHDAIQHAAVGAITQPPLPWINRPTFQQVVEIPK